MIYNFTQTKPRRRQPSFPSCFLGAKHTCGYIKTYEYIKKAQPNKSKQTKNQTNKHHQKKSCFSFYTVFFLPVTSHIFKNKCSLITHFPELLLSSSFSFPRGSSGFTDHVPQQLLINSDRQPAVSWHIIIIALGWTIICLAICSQIYF